MFKVDQRTTKDLDTLIRELKVDRDNVELMLNKIISIDLGDGVQFELINLVDSQQQRIYDGFKAKLKMKFNKEPSIINFDLDIGVGDAITPEPVIIHIPLVFEERKNIQTELEMLAYPLETILAEKTEIILHLGVKNSRMKDFYDIHLILNSHSRPNIDEGYKAFANTWNRRHPSLNIDDERFEDWYYVIDEISTDEIMNNKAWGNYTKDRTYARDIEFQSIIKDFRNYIDSLKEVYTKKDFS